MTNTIPLFHHQCLLLRLRVTGITLMNSVLIAILAVAGYLPPPLPSMAPPTLTLLHPTRHCLLILVCILLYITHLSLMAIIITSLLTITITIIITPIILIPDYKDEMFSMD